MTTRRLKATARTLRRTQTEAEAHLWYHLRARRLAGFKFRRQHPVAGHVADFACEEARLIVEIDGSQHAESESDAHRTAALESAGYHILRFWNHEVLQDTDAVLTAILDTLNLATNR